VEAATSASPVPVVVPAAAVSASQAVLGPPAGAAATATARRYGVPDVPDAWFPNLSQPASDPLYRGALLAAARSGRAYACRNGGSR
jgi:hypothetical protein